MSAVRQTPSSAEYSAVRLSTPCPRMTDSHSLASYCYLDLQSIELNSTSSILLLPSDGSLQPSPLVSQRLLARLLPDASTFLQAVLNKDVTDSNGEPFPVLQQSGDHRSSPCSILLCNGSLIHWRLATGKAHLLLALLDDTQTSQASCLVTSSTTFRYIPWTGLRRSPLTTATLVHPIKGDPEISLIQTLFSLEQDRPVLVSVQCGSRCKD